MPKLGLIAGSGRFPLLVAQEAQRAGVAVVAFGFNGVTDPALKPLVEDMRYFALGQLDKPIAAFKQAGVTQIVMAGKVQHASLFGGVLPDLRAAKLLMRLPDKRTDTILRAVADEFKKDGLELISSASYLSHLLMPSGAITRRTPSASERADIVLGWKAAKAVAGFDIGQSVVVRDGTVISVEAMEGTDACVRRAGEIAASQGGKPTLTLVKVAKPGQDLRFDIPVLGLESLPAFSAARVSTIAVEVGTTLIFDKEEFICRANELKLAVIGYPAEGPTL